MNPANDSNRTNYHRHESECSVQSGQTGEVLTSSSSSIDERNGDDSHQSHSVNNAIGESLKREHDLDDKGGEIETEKAKSVCSIEDGNETVTAMENMHMDKEDFDQENSDNVKREDNHGDGSDAEHIDKDRNLGLDENSGENAGEEENLLKERDTNKDRKVPENDNHSIRDVDDDNEETDMSDEENSETSEKIGLLVGSMAEKLCNISHKKTAQNISSELREESAGLNDDNGGKLHQNGNEEKDETVGDVPHNIEC